MRKRQQKILLHSYNKHFFSFDKKKLFTCFEKYIQSKTKYLIAVSGGSDSMFLSYALFHYYTAKKYPLTNLVFVYCDHKVRKNTTQEISFLREYFAGLPFLTVQRNQGGKTTEESLRKRRYAQFLTLAQKEQCQYVIFGHNLTDRIESTFLNLLRGSHLSGFLSMRVLSSHHLLPGLQVFRPLLTLEKSAITSLCKTYSIPYTQDITNTDPTVSLRNHLRLNILPSLYTLSHKHNTMHTTFCESMQKVYESCENISSFDPLTLQAFAPSPYRHADFAWKWKTSPRAVTKDMLAGLFNHLGMYADISSSLLDEVISFIHRSSGGHIYVRGIYLFLAHDTVYLIGAPKDFWKKPIDKKRSITTLGAVPLGKEKISITDKTLLGATLRYPKTGDIYKGKSRSKWCINTKIPVFWRIHIPVAVKDNRIIHVFYSG